MDKVRYYIRFNRKNKLRKDGTATVQIECYLNKKRRFFDTLIRLKPEQWDNKKLEVRANTHPNANQLNHHIREFIRKLESYEMKILNANKPFNLGMFDNLFNGSEVATFNEFIEKEIQQSTLTKATINSHLTTLRRLNEYNPNINFEDLNKDLLQALERYFKSIIITYKNGSKKKLSHNTIAKYFKNIKVYTNLAIDKGHITIDNYPFRTFNFSFKQSERTFLESFEIEKLENLSLTGKQDYIRDLFLFACYTGLRFSDVMDLKKRDIVYSNGNYWIIKEMVKTKETVRIPIYLMFNNEPHKLIKKYESFERLNIFEPISAQYVNRELKKLAKLANINKVLTFHVARHTTATFLSYKNVDIVTLQRILGHKKLETTLIYTHTTANKIANDIKAVNF